MVIQDTRIQQISNNWDAKAGKNFEIGYLQKSSGNGIEGSENFGNLKMQKQKKLNINLVGFEVIVCRYYY